VIACFAGRAGAPVRGPARRLLGLPIDLNRADAATLETLPGIGAARARAIVAARPFARVEELDRVPGIGPRTLAALAGLVGVGPAPAAGPEPAGLDRPGGTR
jgi:predicted DNA-binding helix-hairpin-helix protein